MWFLYLWIAPEVKGSWRGKVGNTFTFLQEKRGISQKLPANAHVCHWLYVSQAQTELQGELRQVSPILILEVAKKRNRNTCWVSHYTFVIWGTGKLDWRIRSFLTSPLMSLITQDGFCISHCSKGFQVLTLVPLSTISWVANITLGHVKSIPNLPCI